MQAMQTLQFDITIKKSTFNFKGKLDIQWQQPAIHVIFGPSGCGKSHLLRAICGLEKTNGKISFNNQTWLDTESDKKQNTPCHQRKVAMVFQDHQLFPHLNVKQNLMFALDRSEATEQDFEQTIKQLNIEHLLQHSIDQLSGGEKQRVALGRSLLSKPDLLLMDEPLASLDWQSKAEIMPFIEHVARQWSLPILYVSHDIHEVMQLADHIIFMNKENGQSHIEKSGPLMELSKDINNSLNLTQQAGSIISGQWANEPFQNDGLAKVQLQEQALYVNHSSINALNTAGAQARLYIRASDVSISLSHAQDSSILNILFGQITDMKFEESGQCLVQLYIDGQSLLSRISAYSAKRLNLKVGLSVFAQVKAVALSK